MQSFWGDMKDNSDAQIWWASQQGATEVPYLTGSDLFHTVYVLPTTDGLSVTKATSWALIIINPWAKARYSKRKPLRLPCITLTFQPPLHGFASIWFSIQDISPSMPVRIPSA